MAAIYKNTWLIKNKETNEIFIREESFELVLCHAKNEVDFFVNKLRLTTENEEKLNPKEIAEYVATVKEKYKNMVFYNPYDDKEKGNVWGFIFNSMKHEFIDFKYENQTILRDLYIRLGNAVADKVIVQLTWNGKEKFNEYGIQYIDARLFDPKYDTNWIILSNEQYNFLRLVNDLENPIVHKAFDLTEIHQDFIEHGLV